MQLMNFLNSLLPRVEKSRVAEDLRITISELESVVSSNYKHSADYFRANKFASSNNKDLSTVFYRNFNSKGTKQPNIISEVSVRLDNLIANAQFILDYVEKELSSDIIPEGLTVKKAAIIRAAEQLSFASRYSIDLLNLLYVNEAIEANAEVEESLKLAPAAEKHVVSNISKFAVIVATYGIKQDEFEKSLGKIPDIELSKNTVNSVTGMYSEGEVDPFAGSMTVGFQYNPIYHMRLVVAEWQASRYKANKDKKKILELRLLHLKLVQDKKNDPKLENEIVYLQGRIDKIERYLKDVEDTLESEAA